MNHRSFSLFPRRFPAPSVLALILALVGGLAGQNPASPLTLLSREGRRTVPTSSVGDQEFVALDDLAAIFRLALREDSLGAMTVTYKGKTIVLTPDQPLVSVGGRLVSLPAAPTRWGRRWLVPVEFIGRALALVYDTRLDLRKPSHLLIVGDLRVPLVTVRYELLGASARLTIDAAPGAASTVAQDNERITIKFDADALDLAAVPAIQQQGLIQAVGQLDPLTLAVDLGPRFAAFRAATLPAERSSRLVIDIVPARSESQVPPAAAPAPQPDLPGPTLPQSGIRTIAVDAGHGGSDEGAKGADGTKEKDLTLGVARRIKAVVEGRLGIRVLLTRDDDKTVAIDDRTALANNNKADVFLSLHANGSLRPTAAGAAVLYALFEHDADDAARRTLAPLRLPSFGDGVREIELLPWHLAQIRHLSRSEALANIIEQQLHDRVPLAPHAVDRAPLRVLESANMPAVILEMGYLSNAEQEKQLSTPEFQSTLVQGILDALLKFRDYLDETRQAPSATGSNR